MIKLHCKLKKRWLGLLIMTGSCVIPYDFTQDSFERMLVVEGYVTDRAGDHRIYLSWSGEFEEREFEMEEGASVTVFENGDRQIHFLHTEGGLYLAEDPSFRANRGNSYILKVEVNNSTYMSSEVTVLPCAEIESVGFVENVLFRPGEQRERKTLSLQVTTMEDPEASRYYRFNKQETWLALATESRNRKIKPIFEIRDGVPVDVSWEITEFDNITYCWPISESRGISIATSEGLQYNRLTGVNVSMVDLYSDKLLYKYSALIRQFSIPKEAHHFLSLMKQFSEGEGTLFEVQPGFIEGNLHSLSDPEEQVIGIFYASEVKEKRIFVRLTDLSPSYRAVVFQHARSCEAESVLLPITESIPDPGLTEQLLLLRDSMMLKRGLVISDVLEEGMPDADVVYLTNGSCIDCRGRGTNVKPEW